MIQANAFFTLQNYIFFTEKAFDMLKLTFLKNILSFFLYSSNKTIYFAKVNGSYSGDLAKCCRKSTISKAIE